MDSWPASTTRAARPLQTAIGGQLFTLAPRTRRPASPARLLASVVAASSDGISVKDRQLRYVLLNRAALASFPGVLAPHQVLGRRARDLLPEEVARQVDAADRAVLAGHVIAPLVVDFAADAHPARTVSVTKSLWRDGRGRVLGIVNTSRDVTQQREAEQRLRRLQADLLRASRLGLMGVMAGGLAHELSQPLSAAAHSLEAGRLLQHRDAPAADAAWVDALAQVVRAGDIVRQLRGFVARGSPDLRPETLDPLLRQTVELVQADLAAVGATLSVDLPADLGCALLDRTQFQQVLLNLIRNAAEAMMDLPPGRPRRVALAAARGTDGIRIVVADTGPGLDPAVRAQLFRPFISTKADGLGIGLAMCRTIVEGHGGRLRAKDGTEGTRFDITLPPARAGA